MKIAFFSSVLNHHQIAFCDNMYQIYGDQFVFVSTMNIEEQRIKLGYSLFDRSYNLKMHKSDELKKQAAKLFQDADIVIIGVKLDEWLKVRLKNKKITFFYKERLFKEKPSLYWRLRCLAYVIKTYYPFRNTPFYMLAASAYSLEDYKSLGFFQNKTFAWGYFPPFIVHDPEELCKKKQADRIHVFFAGRMIPCKHVDYVLAVAKALKGKNINFCMDIAGTGPLENDLKAAAKDMGLEDVVNFTGSMPPTQVREYMEKANIYLFTSNREEGWGAVLNEAMNSGCAVVASRTAGSTKFMIKDGDNGLIYSNDSVEQLIEKVIWLIEHPSSMNEMGRKAYETIANLQNCEIAAKRFSEVAEALYNKKPIPAFEDGPMKRLI